MLALALLAAIATAPPAAAHERTPAFRVIAPGVELAVVDIGAGEMLHAVRIDPAVAHVVAAAAAAEDGRSRTAGQWAKDKHLSVVINAGMFALEDMSSHEGYFRAGGRVLQPAWKRAYKSVLAVDDKSATMADCGARCPSFDGAPVVVQNLRLIGAGKGVWSENGRKWSEAAVAVDGEGRVLFLFSRAPFSMAQWNARVLASGLGVVRAMHMEGGPEASLSIHVPGVDLDLCGSYETGFRESDDNRAQWPIPNVLGVAAPWKHR